ncbi:GntR family transcriptional regulator [Aliiruegeria sabulilitoris]|uniref:GntR family transcriptional regulator n=1 Tax=Aliiruegeria sabulilitoris TaxID=1510458 RepID=UPI00083552A4|nr:GntR family transcriptional regulator [Aliiruegeria sabulilitoris]NDR59099.1 GntR family transcriptional regulator [Pseudoruegeria sp. M32A2M]
MSDQPAFRSLDPIVRPSVADQVFQELHKQIVWLTLPPGARLSEVEVSKVLGVSRQPVRDAFYRLSQLGFLEIRPQRATRVSLISVDAVLQARFVRTALEVEIVRAACGSISETWKKRLNDNLAQQEDAVRKDDRNRFHQLDDAFHEMLCLLSDHAFAWQIIQESKAHLDRVRLLSLSFNQQFTLEEHRGLVAALLEGDADGAEKRMRDHLSRLYHEINRIRSENPDYFAEE